MECRHCAARTTLSMADLGSAPPSNAYVDEDGRARPEVWYPLRVLVCEQCWLAQTQDFTSASDLFREDYAYFSSTSASWLSHANAYVEAMTARFDLRSTSRVVEVGANDGYLLQYFHAKGIPCTGIEPTSGTARAARAKGLDMREVFFGAGAARALSAEGLIADLMVANNVLAHVPAINDFVAGFVTLLKPHGVVTFEFPHLCRLIEETQFDTIYHEHFSYLSLLAVRNVFATHGLSVFDVDELPTHGGSLRVFAQRADKGNRPTSPAVQAMLAREREAGVASRDFYQRFQARAVRVKNDFLSFLLAAKARHARVAAYGAAAKGSTLLNYAGVRSDLLSYVVDRNPAKQGKYLPGSHIPIVTEQRLRATKPDYIVLLPWNLKPELTDQLSYARTWGGRFVTAIPKLEITE
ncbi:MAG: class I SAM-dependent methyltransferase [Myxococcales bacterium]|nr:class I SAM-dependent methyltransferase [Myxococcales bacterium]